MPRRYFAALVTVALFATAAAGVRFDLRRQRAAPAGLQAGKLRHEFAFRFLSTPHGTTNIATAHATSLVTQVVDGAPVFSVMQATEDPEVMWRSELVNQTATSWSEKGNITFDRAGTHALLFETPGLTGVILADNYGGIVYNITGGTGRFAGATGMMTDFFYADPAAPPNAPFGISAWGFYFL